MIRSGNIKNEILGSGETLSCKAPVYGGDRACPPEPPLRFMIVSNYLPGRYHSRGCHSGGGGGITCRSPLRALRKIFWGFPKPDFTLRELRLYPKKKNSLMGAKDFMRDLVHPTPHNPYQRKNPPLISRNTLQQRRNTPDLSQRCYRPCLFFKNEVIRGD